MRPLIGVTCNYDFESDNSKVFNGYYESIIGVGGLPLLIPATENLSAQETLMHMDGLLLTGGQDIDPYLFAEDPDPNIGMINPIRDRLEIQLCQEAIRRDMPVLGICKGLQIMAIVSGGTLYQDINTGYEGKLICHNQKSPGCYGIHQVSLRPNTLLKKIFGKDTLRVNSFHHQAVKTPGESLVVSATSKDGIIEAVEATNLAFFLGVQWHPEQMTGTSPEMAKLFKAFVSQAASTRSATDR
ncbi:MAG TPA: gamma-glutamyl-gamma-aminobutyrate hydrolase family protein [Bacillota bacterium]|nr:gamma-glutamyl-gamma-aminobutyrate hydrolase family protein [Bacillota bacterium]